MPFTAMSETLHTDVLIAGGGPCGLMLANELGRRGVRCLLIDLKPGTARDIYLYSGRNEKKKPAKGEK